MRNYVTSYGAKEFYPQPEKKMVVGKAKLDLDICYDRLQSIPDWMEEAIYDLYHMTLKPEDFYITARAECDDRDQYDEETGIDIVSEKLDMKYHNKKAKKCRYIAKLARKIADTLEELAAKHDEKYEFIKKDLYEYYGGK